MTPRHAWAQVKLLGLLCLELTAANFFAKDRPVGLCVAIALIVATHFVLFWLVHRHFRWERRQVLRRQLQHPTIQRYYQWVPACACDNYSLLNEHKQIVCSYCGKPYTRELKLPKIAPL